MGRLNVLSGTQWVIKWMLAITIICFILKLVPFGSQRAFFSGHDLIYFQNLLRDGSGTIITTLL